MSAERQRFLDIFSRPWQENAELHSLALRELDAALERKENRRPACFSRKLTAASDTLNRADRHATRRKWLVRSLYLLASLASLLAAGHVLNRYIDMGRAWHELSWNYAPLAETFDPTLPEFLKNGRYRSPLTGHLDEKDASFMTTSHNAEDAGRWKTLWDTEPNNPAYFACYAWNSNHLPTGFMETASRIDPDNAWFPLHAASRAADSCVRYTGIQSTGVWRDRRLKEWLVLDEEAFRNALGLIHAAANKPRFDSYADQMKQRAVRLLPPRRDVLRDEYRNRLLITSIAFFRMHSNYFSVCQVMEAEAQRCARDDDREGFKKVLSDWYWLNREVPRNASTLDVAMSSAAFNMSAPYFRTAAEILQLPDEAGKISAMEERMKSRRNMFGYYSDSWSLLTVNCQDSSDLFCGQGPEGTIMLIRKQGTWSDPRPQRYASHAFLSGVGSVPALLVFWLLCGLFALHRFRHGALTRALSSRASDLLRITDWLWIAGLGILLPLAYYLVITRFTRWSAREISYRDRMVLQVVYQHAAALLLVVISSVIAARWRLAARCRVVGIFPGPAWLGLLCLLVTAAALPVLGTFSYPFLVSNLSPKIGESWWLDEIAILLPAMIWLLANGVRAFFGRERYGLRRVSLARVLVPVWALAASVMSLSEPAHYAEECHWVGEDKLFEITPDAYPTRYANEIARIMRTQYLSVLDDPGANRGNASAIKHD